MSDSEKRDIVIPGEEPPEILPVNSKPQTNIQDHQALPLGTRISEFEVTSLIGIGGFGIVYLAHDNSLGRDVALKEYMPLVMKVTRLQQSPNAVQKLFRPA